MNGSVSKLVDGELAKARAATAAGQSAPAQSSGRVQDEVRNAQAELAELARMASQLGAMLAGNASASQREQGVRDLIDAVGRACARSSFRLDEIAAAHRRAARSG
ncbi:MAG TPA: hypothetical protein VIT02_06885 [Burkholderiaceae bacterium]